MRILKSLLKFCAVALIGVFSFYLSLCVMILPATLPWLVGSQATKILKTPVRVRSISFNPYLWRLSIRGLQVSDAAKDTIIGFDRFKLDLSFLSLFKKALRIESLVLEGLKVNVVLSGKGNINLLGLVPLPPPEKAGAAADGDTAAAAAMSPLPQVIADSIDLTGATVTFCDRSVNPNFTTSLNDMDLRIRGLSTRSEDAARASFRARLDDKGSISTELTVRPFKVPLELETTFSLDDYALKVLTPYVGKYTGRAVKSGKLNLSMDYRIADNQLEAAHRLRVQSFDFGERVESKDALHLPFGLALALLEDSQDRISISLPVTGDISKPEFHYFHLIGQVLRNFFYKLVTKPFTFLGSLVSQQATSEELGYIKFHPGKTDLLESEKEKLNLIVKALAERPRLYLKVNGCYDPDLDWRSIKEDVFNNDFQVLEKESKRLESWVYQQLYQRRFGIKALWRLTRAYRLKGKAYDEEKLNAEIKRQLIEEGAQDKLALRALAEARAKMVYDFVIAAGLPEGRAGIKEIQETKARDGLVPLELGLTIFGEVLEEEGPVLPIQAQDSVSEPAAAGD